MGASRRQKNKLTLVMRQGLVGLFDFHETGELEGKILPSVLVVPSTKPARLDLMSHEEPSVWLESHSFWWEGKLERRRKGEKVGPCMESWREARRQQPRLFDLTCSLATLWARR